MHYTALGMRKNNPAAATEADLSFSQSVDIFQELANESLARSHRVMVSRLELDRANILANQGRWGDAVAAYKRVDLSVCDDRTRKAFLNNMASLEFAAGDESGYRRACSDLLSQDHDTLTIPDKFSIVLQCVIGDNAVDTPDKIVALAQEVATSQPPNPVLRTALGAALFHAGKVDEAIATLNVALPQHALAELAAPSRLDEIRISRLLGETVLAIAYRAQGNSQALDEQIATLRATVSRIETSQPGPKSGLAQWALKLAIELTHRRLMELDVASPDAS